jgi:hypothetical protein
MAKVRLRDIHIPGGLPRDPLASEPVVTKNLRGDELTDLAITIDDTRRSTVITYEKTD